MHVSIQLSSCHTNKPVEWLIDFYGNGHKRQKGEGRHTPQRSVGRVLVSLPWTIEPIVHRVSTRSKCHVAPTVTFPDASSPKQSVPMTRHPSSSGIRIVLFDIKGGISSVMWVHLRAPVQRHRRRSSQTKRNAFRSFLKRKDEFVSRTEGDHKEVERRKKWETTGRKHIMACSIT